MLYDADCGVCRWLLGRILTWDRAGNLRVLALQTPEAQALLAAVPEDEWMKSWHLVDRAGTVHSAGDAFPSLLDELPMGKLLKPAVVLGRIPVNASYRWFAANRSLFGKYVPAAAKEKAQNLIDGRTAGVRDLPA